MALKGVGHEHRAAVEADDRTVATARSPFATSSVYAIATRHASWRRIVQNSRRSHKAATRCAVAHTAVQSPPSDVLVSRALRQRSPWEPSAGTPEPQRAARPSVVEEELTVAQSIVRLLEREGVKCVFGVPGGPLTGFFEALRESRQIRFVLAKHEAAAAYMASSHARVTGQLSVCCATSGPGATNALTGIASAFADSMPVLFLSGQVATNVFGKGAIQDSSVFGTDLVSVFRPVTKLSTMLPNADCATDFVRAAIRSALAGRRGPVHLNLPADLLRRRTKYVAETQARYRGESRVVDRSALAEAARILAQAKRPCILAGHGVAVSRASDELQRVAHQFQVPVVTSPKGKGVFPEADPLSLGVLGFGGHDTAEAFFRSGDIDVLLVVGSSLNEFVTDAWTIPIRPAVALVQIDIDPTSVGKNYPVEVAVVGDADASLRELRELWEAASDPRRVRHAPPRPRDSAHRYLAPGAMTSEASPIKPQRLVRELRNAMPDDAMLFVDNGTAIVWASHYFETRVPNTYFIDLGLASMGSAVAGVVGGALAAKNRRAVALVGDAAFAMHGFEVHTAVEYKLPIVWIVLNNAGHGMVHQGDTLMHGEPLGVSDYRVPLDAAAVARAVGAQGVTVKSPSEFAQALAVALTLDGPTVIDAIIDQNEVAPTLVKRVQTLDRFLTSGAASAMAAPTAVSGVLDLPTART
jgi:acetolactate synthase I/II/III large subunit